MTNRPMNFWEFCNENIGVVLILSVLFVTTVVAVVNAVTGAS